MVELPGNFRIRRAGVADVPAILELIISLAEFEKLTPPGAGAGERLKRDIAGEHPRFQAFLVEADGKAVGYAIGFEIYSTFLAEPRYYVEDIFILKDYRGQGIGHALFAVLAEEALCRGCVGMCWTALDWNQPAIDFYEGLGATLKEEWRELRLDKEGVERLAEGSQTFFWHDEWQKCERRADEDIRAGKVKRFSCVTDAAAHLKDGKWKSS